MIQSDAQGFLTGTPISSDDGPAEDLSSISKDVRAIRRALLGGSDGTAPSPGRVERGRDDAARPVTPAQGGLRASDHTVALLRKAITPQTGGASTSAIRKDAKAAEAVSQAVAAVRASNQAARRDIAKPVSRDGRGRFVRGESRGVGGAGPEAGNPLGSSGEVGTLRGVADRIAGAIKESGNGMAEADPAIRAMHEVAQPMARGYGLLAGGNREKRQEGWLRRIWTSLAGFRKDESAFDKIAAKRLKAIEEKPGEKSGGGFFGGLLGMLGGALTRLPIIGGLLGAGGTAAGGLGKLLLGGGRGLLRKIPILGTLLAGFGAASDIYSTETDDSLTREQKDKRTGKAAGGLAGTLGGMWAGAQLGAAVGALGGPIGAAIGGVVGGAAGMFFGDKAGQVIGETVGGWVSDLRNADIPGMISNAWTATTDAISSVWDSVAGKFSSAWDAVTASFGEVGDAITKKWDGFVDAAKAGWDSISSVFASAYEGLKSLPGIGPAIEAAESAARKTKEFVQDAYEGAKELGTKAVDKAKDWGSSAYEGVKNAGSAIGDGATDLWAKMTGGKSSTQKRAIETASAYRQGNIGGLDEAHTRALVASTAATESAGGKLDVVNPAGYVGRYQAGAGWLADAGLIKGGSAAVRDAMKADGFTNEYKWGQAGGMTKFLKNADNWNGGLDYDKYLSSADTQDAAFKTISDQAYRSLSRRGVITPDMSQDAIAGILKARHISGEGGAIKAARGETGPADANGTTAKKYLDDLAAGNVYTETFVAAAGQPAPSGAVSASPESAPTAPAVPTTPAAPSIPVAPPAQAVVASVPMVSVPTMPAPPTIESAPPTDTPLATGGGGRPITVNVPTPDVGQDIRDRQLAHIVTGGFSG